jgi:aspartyl-tRNA(Asn)/glutamyl-tRNA(Gln) amidotransferase subunit A
MPRDLTELTLAECSRMLRAREISAADLAAAYLARAEAENPKLNAYLEIYDDVIAQAKAADARLAAEGEAAPMLCGVPIALNDNILVAGRLASSASKILEGYRAPYSATVVEKLLAQGAVLIGRANMDEFAMGGSGENSAFGPAKNPAAFDRVPGGSSSGSTVAVAAGLAAAALGSDTGGSIREPAGLCGVVGFKPTYGAVSRYGLMAMASSFDQIGPIAKTVEDARLVFDAIRGRDGHDLTTDERREGKEIKVVGVPKGWEAGVDEDVRASFEASLGRLRQSGVDVREIELPTLPSALACYYILVPAEVSSNMARYDGVKFGKRIEGKDLLDTYKKTRGELLGAEVKRRILIGAYVLSKGYADQYYRTAQAARRAIVADFARAFETVDAIATPTSPFPAWKIGEKIDDPLKMYAADIFTVGANVIGSPAISIPDGTVTRDGADLPIGFHLVAPRWADDRLLDFAEKLEKLPRA